GDGADAHRGGEQFAAIDVRTDRCECGCADRGGDAERRDEQAGLLDGDVQGSGDFVEQSTDAQEAGRDEKISGTEHDQAIQRHPVMVAGNARNHPSSFGAYTSRTPSLPQSCVNRSVSSRAGFTYHSSERTRSARAAEL